MLAKNTEFMNWNDGKLVILIEIDLFDGIFEDFRRIFLRITVIWHYSIKVMVKSYLSMKIRMSPGCKKGLKVGVKLIRRILSGTICSILHP